VAQASAGRSRCYDNAGWDSRNLVASCLNDACRHTALIDVSKYADDVGVPSFASKVVCAKCGARGRKIDVRPNWKEQPPRESLTGKQWR